MSKKSIHKAIDRLNALYPLAKDFREQLMCLYQHKQDSQLDVILPYLNRLVVGKVYWENWPKEMQLDSRYHELLDCFTELKNIRNHIIHDGEPQALNYEDYMRSLSALYKYGDELPELIMYAKNKLTKLDTK